MVPVFLCEQGAAISRIWTQKVGAKTPAGWAEVMAANPEISTLLEQPFEGR
jgi:hypothetical protein